MPRRKRIGHNPNRRRSPLSATRPANLFEHQREMVKQADETGVCPLCGKPIEAASGAKVYHWDCLYDSLGEVRERQ